jgi:circadian clock protein KaiB
VSDGRHSETDRFEAALEARGTTHFGLKLYVTAGAPASRVAISRLRATLEEALSGRYSLEVIDVHRRPELASLHQIVATPTLVKELPEPVRILVGDMADRSRVLVSIDAMAPG